MRDVINKGISEEDLQNATRKAFEMGWNSVKLYFINCKNNNCIKDNVQQQVQNKSYHIDCYFCSITFLRHAALPPTLLLPQ